MEVIAIKDLSILIKRSSRRKTVELSVERDGEVILYAPENVGREKLECLVLEKMLWIYRQLGRKEEELHNLPEKEFVSGEGFYYRGRKYKLKLLDEPVPGQKTKAFSGGKTDGFSCLDPWLPTVERHLSPGIVSVLKTGFRAVFNSCRGV